MKLSINIFSNKEIQGFYDEILKQLSLSNEKFKYRDFINLVYGVDLTQSKAFIKEKEIK